MNQQFNFTGIHDDPLLSDAKDQSRNVKESLIHIRIQQRNGRKTLTTVQGIDPKYDLKKIVKVAKKEFSCNGTVVQHPEYGEVIQLQGDQRTVLQDLLLRAEIGTKDLIKLHGF